MLASDSKPSVPLQAPDPDATNRLADALEQAQFVHKVPAPRLRTMEVDYMRARLAVEYAKPVPAISVADAKFIMECCDSAYHATRGSTLRLEVDMWAQAERAHRDFVICQANKENRVTRTEIVRRIPVRKRGVRSV